MKKRQACESSRSNEKRARGRSDVSLHFGVSFPQEWIKTITERTAADGEDERRVSGARHALYLAFNSHPTGL